MSNQLFLFCIEIKILEMTRLNNIFSIISDQSNVNLAELAYRFRKQGDLPNAITFFEALGEHYARNHLQDIAIKAGVPAFFSSFMAKSGGTYLHMCLLKTGAAEIFHTTQHPLDFHQSYLIESWLRVFMRGGAACHTHMLPTPYNLKIMRNVGITNVWLHVRDPRQSAYSSFWHTEGLGQGVGSIADDRVAEISSRANAMMSVEHAQGLKPLLREGFDERMKFFFTRENTWLEDWLKFERRNDGLEIMVTSFDDMLRDASSLLASVFRFFGASTQINIEALPKEANENRFRSGSTDEWMQSCSDELKKWMSDQMNIDTIRRFGWVE